MRITVNIRDATRRRLKRESIRTGKTMSELVEAALRLLLDRRERRAKLPPLPTFDLGKPKVDLADRDALYEAMQQ